MPSLADEYARWKGWRAKVKGRKTPPKPKPSKLYMFDDVNVSLMPPDADAYAGYVDGKWKTWEAIRKLHPGKRLVSIAVFASDDADVLDVESGDATNADAVAWVKRQKKDFHLRGSALRRPGVYTAVSNGQALIETLAAAGLRLNLDYEWWSAHYDPRLGEHICSPKCWPGLKWTANATQFTDHADNKSLDESVCGSLFFQA